MQYAGIDTGKTHCAAHIKNDHGETTATLQIPNNPTGYQRLDDHLEEPAELAAEASTYTQPLAQHFRNTDHTFTVAHPRKVDLITENESKTDENDAEILADLLRVGYLPEAYLPPPDVLQLREIARERREIGQELTRWKNRIRSLLDKHGVSAPYSGTSLWTQDGLTWLKDDAPFEAERAQLLQARVLQLETLQDRRDLIEPILAQHALEDERAHWLMSIPGARWYLACYILGEVGDITRFDSVDAFKSYCACCPKERSTGGRQDPYGVVQHGHKGLKWAFERVGQTLRTYDDNPIKAAYEDRLEATGHHGKAMTVVRREVCELVYWLLTKGEACRWASADLLDRKLADARRLTRET
jgi:transposase